MTCAACVNRITRFLANVDGVEDATVNLATETATVRFDPDAPTSTGSARPSRQPVRGRTDRPSAALARAGRSTTSPTER
jgi:cation transport ATPase